MAKISEAQLKKSVQDRNTWMHLVYLVILGVISWFLPWVTVAISIVQFLAKIATGETVEMATEFGHNLATYQKQITAYLTFASEEKPFPFSGFPSHK